MVEVDQFGNFVRQFSFPNQFGDNDLPSKILKLENNNYLLLGTATGAMGPSFLYNTVPRFLSINSLGDVVWDKNFQIGVSESEPKFSNIYQEADNSLLVLSSDYHGISISSITQDGTLVSQLPLNDYPNCIYIKRDLNNYYVLVTHDGRLIVLNPDGYIE